MKNSIWNKIKKVVQNPWSIFDVFLVKTSKFWSDKKYVLLLYKIRYGKKLNIECPQSFNEKLNWMKLYYRNPLFTMMADKYWVKQYVANKLGPEAVVPCYGCWKNIKDIDFQKLPQRFFLKSTHDSGGGILVDQSQGIDFKRIVRRFNKKTLQGKNWYWHLREFPYKNIEPRIIAEEYLDEGTGRELRDYKFYCFNGKPTYMYITNKAEDIFENYYDLDFNPVNISHGFRRYSPEFTKPQNFEKMIEWARILSEGIPFVRVDFFNVNNRLYFGEYTFYDWGGMKPLNEPWERKLGELIKLPQL